MIEFVLAGILIGVVIGVRFTVLALVPPIIWAIVVATASAAVAGEFGLRMVALGLLLASLQIGYLGGATLRIAATDHATRRSGESGWLRNRFH